MADLDDRYWNIRKEYFIIGHDASQAYDKIIIGLSTAGLIAFYFSAIKTKSFLWLFMIGSFTLIISMSSSLYSLWHRQVYSCNSINVLNDEYEGKSSTDSAHKSGQVMVYRQGLSGITFIISLIIFFIFVLLTNL